MNKYVADFIDIPLDIVEDPCNLQLPDPALLEDYRDLNRRVYWLKDEIDTYDTLLIRLIHRWNAEDKGKPVEEREPIRLFFNTQGGRLDIAFAVMNAIKLSKTPVIGVAVNMAYSAGFFIYMTCHKRYAYPDAYFLIHRGSTSGGDQDFGNFDAATKQWAAQIKRLQESVAENTNISTHELSKKWKNDWYLDVKTAVDKGVVDEVLRDIDDII